MPHTFKKTITETTALKKGLTIDVFVGYQCSCDKVFKGKVMEPEEVQKVDAAQKFIKHSRA